MNSIKTKDSSDGSSDNLPLSGICTACQQMREIGESCLQCKTFLCKECVRSTTACTNCHSQWENNPKSKETLKPIQKDEKLEFSDMNLLLAQELVKDNVTKETEVHKCEICDLYYTTTDFKDHIHVAKAEEEIFPCENCSEEFKKSQLQDHQSKCNKVKCYSCLSLIEAISSEICSSCSKNFCSECLSDSKICGDCTKTCSDCGDELRGDIHCAQCYDQVSCSCNKCRLCSSYTCDHHTRTCPICKKDACVECSTRVECRYCSRDYVCDDCLIHCEQCRNWVCSACSCAEGQNHCERCCDCNKDDEVEDEEQLEQIEVDCCGKLIASDSVIEECIECSKQYCQNCVLSEKGNVFCNDCRSFICNMCWTSKEEKLGCEFCKREFFCSQQCRRPCAKCNLKACSKCLKICPKCNLEKCSNCIQNCHEHIDSKECSNCKAKACDICSTQCLCGLVYCKYYSSDALFTCSEKIAKCNKCSNLICIKCQKYDEENKTYICNNCA